MYKAQHSNQMHISHIPAQVRQTDGLASLGLLSVLLHLRTSSHHSSSDDHECIYCCSAFHELILLVLLLDLVSKWVHSTFQKQSLLCYLKLHTKASKPLYEVYWSAHHLLLEPLLLFACPLSVFNENMKPIVGDADAFQVQSDLIFEFQFPLQFLLFKLLLRTLFFQVLHLIIRSAIICLVLRNTRMNWLWCSFEVKRLSNRLRYSTCEFDWNSFSSFCFLDFYLNHIWRCLLKDEVYHGDYHIEAITHHWAEELLKMLFLNVPILEEGMQIWDAINFKTSGEC